MSEDPFKSPIIEDSHGPLGHWRTKNLSPKKPKEKLKFGRPWVIVVMTVAIFLASQLIATGIVALELKATNGGSLTDALNDSAPAQFLYTIAAEALAIGMVLQLLKLKNLSRASIGLIKPKWSDLWHGLLGFVVFYIILAFVSELAINLIPSINTSQQQDVGFNSITTLSDSILALISLVVLPPLGEEVLVRGYLFSGLRSKWKFVPAAILTSVIFGIAHLELGSGAPPLWTAAIDTFTLSIVLVYLREKTGALYAGMLIHSLNNLIAFFAHFHSSMF